MSEPAIIWTSPERLLADPRVQIRSRLDAHAITRYAACYKAGTKLPPLMCAEIGGLLILIDGWHRHRAALREGISAVPVVVVEARSVEEAKWLAAEENRKHGVPYRPRELRGVFAAYIDAGKHLKKRGLKSYREIGAELGIGHTTIRNWMMKDYPALAKQYGDNDPHAGGRSGDETAEPTWYQPDLLAEEAIQQFKGFQALLLQCNPAAADGIRRYVGEELGFIAREEEDSDF